MTAVHFVIMIIPHSPHTYVQGILNISARTIPHYANILHTEYWRISVTK